MTNSAFLVKNWGSVKEPNKYAVLLICLIQIIGKHWKNGDRIRCQIDDCWWKGTVQKIVHHDAAKKSPFLSIYVNWDNGEKEYLSPWDLEALDDDSSEIGKIIFQGIYGIGAEIMLK